MHLCQGSEVRDRLKGAWRQGGTERGRVFSHLWIPWNGFFVRLWDCEEGEEGRRAGLRVADREGHTSIMCKLIPISYRETVANIQLEMLTRYLVHLNVGRRLFFFLFTLDDCIRLRAERRGDKFSHLFVLAP